MKLFASALLLTMATIGVGCAPAVGQVQMGSPHAAKAPTCPLKFVPVGSREMMPGAPFGPGGQYEMVGVVAVGADAGSDPMSEPIRKLVRPRACALGGEVISLASSATTQNRNQLRAQQSIMFTVWGSIQKTTPQSF